MQIQEEVESYLLPRKYEMTTNLLNVLVFTILSNNNF